MPWTKIFANKEEFESFASLSGEALRGITYREALREAQKELLASDPRVFLIGEGIDDTGGVFGSTVGLAQEFSPARVMDMPIAENAMTGVAMGAALAGMRPILVHMRMDFLPMSMDQIVNHAAKWHYMTGGGVHVPLVIRSIIGRGWGSAAQHSQALHALFFSVPGLRIVMPATPYDAKGLLMASVADGNPVLFIEHRWLYEHTGHVPAAPYTLPLGKGIVRREGTDVTIVALSVMVPEALRAARALEARGISAEVIDPRCLKPLDSELILESVKKTGRLVVADPAPRTGGIGGEIAALVTESDPRMLKAPVRRVSWPDSPVPCSPVLEEAYYTSAADIEAACVEVAKIG